QAATIDNVNIRGNQIEQIITNAGNFHRAEDISEALASGTTVKVDVKTKLIGLGSSPKAYNIDKFLTQLANGNTVFSFLFLGINLSAGTIATKLISFLDNSIVNATRIQFHWAGRNSRGVTQLTGDFNSVFSAAYSENVDVQR